MLFREMRKIDLYKKSDNGIERKGLILDKIQLLIQCSINQYYIICNVYHIVYPDS